jgi:plastocyanin
MAMGAPFAARTASAALLAPLAALAGLGGVGAVIAATPATLQVQVVDGDGLPVRDAVVELHASQAPVGAIRFPWNMAMAQKNLQFTPGTLIVARGSTVAFPNLDNVRHSIYSFSKPARFEIELYGRDQTRTHTFNVAGSVKLGCNIHDKMRGYIRVTDTPFAGKTDHNGYVTLTGMPEGSARLTVWHPDMRAPGNESVSSITVNGGTQTHKLKVALR